MNVTLRLATIGTGAVLALGFGATAASAATSAPQAAPAVAVASKTVLSTDTTKTTPSTTETCKPVSCPPRQETCNKSYKHHSKVVYKHGQKYLVTTHKIVKHCKIVKYTKVYDDHNHVVKCDKHVKHTYETVAKWTTYKKLGNDKPHHSDAAAA